MTTPEDDRSSERQCTCTSEAEGSSEDIQESIVLSDHTLSIGTYANPCSPGLFLRSRSTPESLTPPSTTTSGVSWSHGRSFESLKRALSSGNGRKSLYALTTEQAIRVIGVLEQVSTGRFGCPVTS